MTVLNNQCLKLLPMTNAERLLDVITGLIKGGETINQVLRLSEFQYPNRDRDCLADWLIIYTPERKGGIVKA